MTAEVTDGHRPLATKLPRFNGLTAIACECGETPVKMAARNSMRHCWHQSHRRKLGLQPVEYRWPENSYMVGLSTGGLVQPSNARWENGKWVLA